MSKVIWIRFQIALCLLLSTSVAGDIIEVTTFTRMLFEGCLRQMGQLKPLTVSESSTPFLYDVQCMVRSFKPSLSNVPIMSVRDFMSKYQDFTASDLSKECMEANPTLNERSFDYEIILRTFREDLEKFD